jgi:hypothetical protein
MRGIIPRHSLVTMDVAIVLVCGSSAAELIVDTMESKLPHFHCDRGRTIPRRVWESAAHRPRGPLPRFLSFWREEVYSLVVARGTVLAHHLNGNKVFLMRLRRGRLCLLPAGARSRHRLPVCWAGRSSAASSRRSRPSARASRGSRALRCGRQRSSQRSSGPRKLR